MVRALKKVSIFTDGACLGNPGPGGWAALLRYQNKEKLISGGDAMTTNNRMELQAVISGLRSLKGRCEVQISTDSQYVMNAFEEGWLKNWVANGWKTSNKSQVKNQDLWEELLDLSQQHAVSWQWVKGHAGHRENEIVDSLAREEARKMTMD